MGFVWDVLHFDNQEGFWETSSLFILACFAPFTFRLGIEGKQILQFSSEQSEKSARIILEWTQMNILIPRLTLN